MKILYFVYTIIINVYICYVKLKFKYWTSVLIVLLFACKIRRKDLQQTLIFLFVLFIPILYLFLIYFRNKNKINNLYKVKYDYNQKKLSWILSCISTIITITLLAIRNLPITEHLPDEIVVFVYLGGYIFFPIITLILWLDFLRSTMYLKRLKSYGYEIPVNKKDFDSSLHKLPKTTPATVNPDERNKGSLILFLSSGLWIFRIFKAIIV